MNKVGVLITLILLCVLFEIKDAASFTSLFAEIQIHILLSPDV